MRVHAKKGWGRNQAFAKTFYCFHKLGMGTRLFAVSGTRVLQKAQPLV
jgi:hypothetical protein